MTGFLRVITITSMMMMMVTMMIKERCGYWILGDTLYIIGGQNIMYEELMNHPPSVRFACYCFLAARYDTKNLQHGNYRVWRKVMSEGKQIACFLR